MSFLTNFLFKKRILPEYLDVFQCVVNKKEHSGTGSYSPQGEFANKRPSTDDENKF